MRKIVYYVATSLDGFISGLNGDISGFVGTGNGLKKYLSDLKKFDTVIMGKNTYEFGYKFGLEPGQNPYQHMLTYIFSNSLELENADPNVQIKNINLEEIEKIQNQSGSDIYLCGGGQFAGWLLDNQKIDFLKLKLNPLILGQGVKLFGNSILSSKTELIDSELYDNGLQFMTYKILKS
ncbi:MAG: dihydrofolate reductase family protein [Cyclobacteriaceae bacterium]|nr:dihydrofolate reductase family protein [Cyclobacteriaceae bacterium]